MAVATTHDLPTLRGYWESGDLTLGKTLGLYPDEVVLRGCIRIVSWRNRGCWMRCISTAVCQNVPGIRPR
jgi:4-alpha-glucanotransferase